MRWRLTCWAQVIPVCSTLGGGGGGGGGIKKTYNLKVRKNLLAPYVIYFYCRIYQANWHLREKNEELRIIEKKKKILEFEK